MASPRTRTIRLSLDPAFRLILGRHADDDAGDDDGTTGKDGTDGAGTGKDDAGTGTGKDDAGTDDADDDDKGLGDSGKETLKKVRAEARAAEKKARDEARARAAAEAKVREFEDKDKDDLTKAQDQAKRAADRAEAAERRAVLAEIKVLAADTFADPTDATDSLAGRLTEFVGADGEIDADAITAALAEKLEAKPHWKKPAKQDDGDGKSAGRKRQGDPGQGSGRGNGLTPPDFTDPRALAAEAAKFGIRI